MRMHVYETDGASRDPSCAVCGEDSWDNKTCFESRDAMAMKQKLNKLENRPKVVLKPDNVAKLLNRWKQRKAVHSRLAEQGKGDANSTISQTLGFCITELEEARRKDAAAS